MSQNTVVLKVGMSCQGCVGAVKRVLEKMEGVESFDIDHKEQKVTVKGNVQPEEVFQTVSKTGKKTSFWETSEPPAEVIAAETKPAETAPETKPAEAKPAEVIAAEVKPAETAPETKPAESEPETKTTEAVITTA